MTRLSRALVASLAAASVLTAAACTGSESGSTTSVTPNPVGGTSAPGNTSTKPANHTAVNPYTGIGRVPTTPVIAVKIDDTAPGRPQVNIDKADIVYIEAVEGGLDRLAAIFGTNKPTVGYVRSTRPSDPELLLQYGKLTMAYSGGARVSLQIRKRSGLNGYSNDAGKAYFSRVSRSESDYINVILNLAKVAKKVKTARPKPMGFTFNKSLKGIPTKSGTRVETVVTGSYRQGTPVEFRYAPKLNKYVRYIGGVAQHAADGKLVTATNVIVQSCKITTFGADRDVEGNPAQFTHSVGSGPVSVFRNGKRINGTWSRTTTSRGTVLTASNKKRLPLNPGNTWVVLIRKGIPVTS